MFLEKVLQFRGNWFDRLNKDQLIEDKYRIEAELKLGEAKIIKLENQKKKLFEEGFKATEVRRDTLEWKLRDIERKINRERKAMSILQKKLQVADTMLFLLSNKKDLSRRGIIDKLINLPEDKVVAVLTDEKVRQDVVQGKLDGFVEQIESQFDLETKVEKSDSSIRRLWEQYDESKAGEAYSKFLEIEKSESDQDEDNLFS